MQQTFRLLRWKPGADNTEIDGSGGATTCVHVNDTENNIVVTYQTQLLFQLETCKRNSEKR